MRISDWSSDVCSSDLSPIALPPDPMLVADLTAPTFTVPPRGIKVESKEDVCKRLGRSTDRGDAVVMAWSAGLKTPNIRSEEHTSELQSLMRTSYAVFCLKKKKNTTINDT